MMTKRRGRQPKSATGLDENNIYEKVFFPQFHYEIRAVQVVACRKHMPTRRWFVYDVQKNKPILPYPIYEIRKSGPDYKLIDTKTNQIVFSEIRLHTVIKYADAHVPPRARNQDVQCNQPTNNTDDSSYAEAT